MSTGWHPLTFTFIGIVSFILPLQLLRHIPCSDDFSLFLSTLPDQIAKKIDISLRKNQVWKCIKYIRRHTIWIVIHKHHCSSAFYIKVFNFLHTIFCDHYIKFSIKFFKKWTHSGNLRSHLTHTKNDNFFHNHFRYFAPAQLTEWNVIFVVKKKKLNKKNKTSYFCHEWNSTCVL